MDRITREEVEWLLKQHPVDECRGDCTQSRALIELIAYMDTGLTPEEITANMEMFAAYRHVCGGKSPEEVAQVFAENARLRAERDKAVEDLLATARNGACSTCQHMVDDTCPGCESHYPNYQRRGTVGKA